MKRWGKESELRITERLSIELTAELTKQLGGGLIVELASIKPVNLDDDEVMNI